MLFAGRYYQTTTVISFFFSGLHLIAHTWKPSHPVAWNLGGKGKLAFGLESSGPWPPLTLSPGDELIHLTAATETVTPTMPSQAPGPP